MSASDVYRRPELVKVPEGAAAAEDIIEHWAILIADLRDTEPIEASDAEWAQDVLSCWTGVERLRTDLVATALDPGDIEWVEKVVKASGRVLALVGSPGPTLEGWLDDLEALDRSYDDDFLEDPVERARLARELLLALDHAELFQAALARLGVDAPDDASTPMLERCAVKCAEQADLFAAAEPFVRATGEAFRPDLAEHDPDLALTALKYVAVLDALVELQSEAFLDESPPIEPGGAKEFGAAHDGVSELPRLGEPVTSIAAWLAERSRSSDAEERDRYGIAAATSEQTVVLEHEAFVVSLVGAQLLLDLNDGVELTPGAMPRFESEGHEPLVGATDDEIPGEFVFSLGAAQFGVASGLLRVPLKTGEVEISLPTPGKDDN